MASEIRKILEEIGQLEKLPETVDRQSEILRKFGTIQWIWALKKKQLAREQDKQWLNDVMDRFDAAKSKLLKMDIPPLVRNPGEKLQQLCPGTAAANQVPYPILQLEAVLPLLMQNEAVDPPMSPQDVLTLSNVHPYVSSIVNRYSDQYQYTDMDIRRYWRRFPVTLEQFVEYVQLFGSPLAVPVRIDDFNQKTLDSLHQVGKQILDCELHIPERSLSETMRMSLETTVAIAATILRLMPNLKCLAIGTSYKSSPVNPFEFPNAPLPPLPHLKALRIIYDSDFISLLNEQLVHCYAQSLEVYMDESETDDMRKTLPPPGVLSLTGFSYRMPLFAMVRNQKLMYCLERIRSGSLKKLHFHVLNALLHQNSYIQFIFLVTTLQNMFGETLEELKLTFEPNKVDSVLPTNLWMLGIQFPKLKHLELKGLLPLDNGAFLLMFPALEVFVFDGEDVVGMNTKSFVNLYPDRRGMLRSNVWKLFPKLEKVKITRNGFVRHQVTREDCLEYQRKQGFDEKNELNVK